MMHDYQAVILAAGRGARLGRLTSQCHKALLPIGVDPLDPTREMSLLLRQLDVLQGLGVADIVIVVGHKREQLIHAVAGRRSGSTSVRLVTNLASEISSSGSLHSLQFAVSAGYGVLSGRRPTLVMDADIIYHREALRHFLAVPGDSAVLVCDRYESSAEQVLVFGSRERPRFLGKGLPDDLVDGEPCLGEATGIIVLSPGDHRLACSTIRWMVGDPSAPDGTLERRGFGPARQATEHEELTDRLMRLGRMRASVFSGEMYPFMEVDTEEDYQRLVEQVYPALIGSEGIGR